MLPEIAQHALFFTVAFVSGAINAVAGGGSFLLFPILMFGGLSAVAANIMCSIGMWPGSLASSYAYFRELNTPVSTLKPLLVFCVAGSAIGAWILLYFPESTFEALVPWLLLAATLIFAFGRRLIGFLRLAHASTHHRVIYLGMLCIAIYGGYFGAGMGILMLAMLQLAGHTHMHQMNALKTVLGSAISASGVLIFMISGEVEWHWAPALMAGGMAGGYLGTKYALRVEPEKIRRFVVVIAFAMTAYFFSR